jgi:endonuclease YncB( thermonuclease family)
VVVILLLAPLLFGCASKAFAGEIISGVANVHDGDTLKINGIDVRLWGIDAPEDGQRCAKAGSLWRCDDESTEALERFVGTRQLSCEKRRLDQRQRVVAVCSVEYQDVGSWMVQEGWALDFPRYSKGYYSPLQAEAEKAKRGLWQGEFDLPWEWRKERAGKRK